MRKRNKSSPAKPVWTKPAETSSLPTTAIWLVILLIWTSMQVKYALKDADFTVSGLGVWESDEGWYAYNAVSLVRYGELSAPGDFATGVFCPLLTLFQFVYFKILGISLWTSRIQGVIAFIIGQFLFLFLWKKMRMTGAGLLALCMIVMNYALFTHARSSLAENYAGIYLALFTLILIRDKPLHFGSGLLLGAVGLAAVLTKPTFVSFLAGALLFFLVRTAILRSRFTFREAAVVTLGILVVTLVGSVLLAYFWILPHQTEWNLFIKECFSDELAARTNLGTLANLAKFFKRLVVDPWASFPFLLSFLSLPLLVAELRDRNGKNAGGNLDTAIGGGLTTTASLLLWGVCLSAAQMLSIGVNPYQPIRYYCTFAWTWGILITVVLHKEYGGLGWVKGLFTPQIFPILAGILTLAVATSPTSLYFATPAGKQRAPILAPEHYVLLSAIGLAILASYRVWPQWRRSRRVLWPLFLCLPIVVFQGSCRRWLSYATESFSTALQDMSNRLPPDCVVMGRMAGFLALEHECRIYCYPHAMNGKNRAPDYVILNRGEQEMQEWRKTYPVLKRYSRYAIDPDFKPIQYRIMNNYYSGTNTVLLKISKDLYRGVPIFDDKLPPWQSTAPVAGPPGSASAPRMFSSPLPRNWGSRWQRDHKSGAVH